MAEIITLSTANSQHLAAFHDLNIRWIEKHFEVEDTDRAMLKDPQTHIYDRSGLVFLCADFETIIGCVAMIPHSGRKGAELAKMAVAPEAQGQGISHLLIKACIEWAVEQSHSEIWLESNTVLAPAISLYRHHGFRELTETEYQATPYSRCNIQMVLEL